MKTSELLSLVVLVAGEETETLAKETLGTGKENEILGRAGSGVQADNLSFRSDGSSENSYWSEGGVYELLGTSSGGEEGL